MFAGLLWDYNTLDVSKVHHVRTITYFLLLFPLLLLLLLFNNTILNIIYEQQLFIITFLILFIIIYYFIIINLLNRVGCYELAYIAWQTSAVSSQGYWTAFVCRSR